MPEQGRAPVSERSVNSSYGYVVVAASFLVQATIIGAIFSYSVFFDALHAEFGWSRAVISGAASLTSLVMGVWAMVLGGLNDRVGPRLILSVAAVLISCGYFLMSLIQAPWQLYLAYALFVGAAFGSHDVLTLSTVARWFDRRRGQMSGIVKTGTSTGQVIVPTVVAMLIAAYGWRSAFVWMAALTGPLVMIAAQFMRTPSVAADTPTGRAAAAHARENTLAGRQAMRTPAFRWISAGHLAVFFCMPTIIVHIVPYATDMGVSRGIAAGVLSVVGAVGVAGRLTIGGIIDRIGARRALRICYLVMLASFIILQFAYTPVLLYVFAVVYGFAHGGSFTAMSPLMAEFFGTRSHGQLFGTVVFIGTISGAVGPVVAGGVYDVIGTYRPVFLLLIVLMVFAVFTMTRLAAFEPQISALRQASEAPGG